MFGWMLMLAAVLVALLSEVGQHVTAQAVLYAGGIICWQIDVAVKKLRDGGDV